MGMDRKKIILIISLFIFAGALAYRITHPYKQERVAELTYSGTGVKKSIPAKKKPQQSAKSPEIEPYIKLDQFLNPPPHSRKVVKNIFFEEKVMPEIKKPVNQPEPMPQIAKKVIPPVVEKRQKVKKDLSLFRSFGYLEESNGERFLFLEKGKRIMVIRKGDRIDGKYIVKDITEKKLTLTAISINEDVHIDLGGF